VNSPPKSKNLGCATGNPDVEARGQGMPHIENFNLGKHYVVEEAQLWYDAMAEVYPWHKGASVTSISASRQPQKDFLLTRKKRHQI